ncbi:MAG TPA: Crp/Fnr family transcriptional regulator [Puia sp.]
MTDNNSNLFFLSFHKHISLTEKEKEIVLSLFTHKKFRKRHYILQEGAVCRHETYIINGLTRTYEADKNGQEHVLQFGVEDWWVGDLYSFLTEIPSNYNIECLENCEVMQITRTSLDELYHLVPKTERYFRMLFQNAFVTASGRIISNISRTALERYTEFREKNPQVENRVTDHQIASYLGITPQSLSRVRRQFGK